MSVTEAVRSTPPVASVTPPTIRSLHATVLSVAIAVMTTVRHWGERLLARLRDDRGQATTEYALVLLAAALVALLIVAWATAGGGAARISRLFNRVVDSVIDRV
ncbi:MAG: DUF4244 domain-containing protein [Actinomycetota bacterium]